MTWQEFISVFDLKVFDSLINILNDNIESNAVKNRQRRKIVRRRYTYHQKADTYTYKLFPIYQDDGRYILKYSKKSRAKNSSEEIILGYFQAFENGWAFIALDSSHMWKKLREMILEKHKHLNTILIGSNMLFCDTFEIENDKRYYFLKDNNQIDETSFFFKTSCVRINDVYVGSNKSFRYFLILDFAYTSSDFTTNNYIDRDTFFKHLKDLSNADILVIFDQRRDLKDQQAVMQKYSDKMIKKLLNI